LNIATKKGTSYTLAPFLQFPFQLLHFFTDLQIFNHSILVCDFGRRMPQDFGNGFNRYPISQCYSGSKGSPAYMAYKALIYLTEISYFTKIGVEFLDRIAG